MESQAFIITSYHGQRTVGNEKFELEVYYYENLFRLIITRSSVTELL